MKIEKNKSLRNFNTFGIDVSARKYVEIYDEEKLKTIFSLNELKDESKLILGGGSNILFTKDFKGLVIKNSIPGIEILKEEGNNVWVKAAAGVIWHQFVLFCIEKKLAGLENLSLIPGLVGAAPMQNIGAYGVEVKETFEEL